MSRDLQILCPFEVGDLISDMDEDYPVFYLVFGVHQKRMGYELHLMAICETLDIWYVERFFGVQEIYFLVSRLGNNWQVVPEEKMEHWQRRLGELKTFNQR